MQCVTRVGCGRLICLLVCLGTWGETRENRQVEVSGVMYPVTDALFHILKQLWLTRIPGCSARRSDVRYIWMDALCVNQEDLQECGRQVNGSQRSRGTHSELILSLGMGTRTAI